MPLIEIGQHAPAFTLKDAHGQPHALTDYIGSPVVLYFYPKDDTPGCTDEACQFRDNLPAFQGLNVKVLGISPDSEESHAGFAAKHGLNFTLLADHPDSTGLPVVCNAYGVWGEKSMYGRTYMGVIRTTYILDSDGKVSHRFENVKVPGHVAEVVTALGGQPVIAPPPAVNAASKRTASAGSPKKAGKKAAKKAAKKVANKKPAKAPSAAKAANKSSGKASKKTAASTRKPAGKKAANKAPAKAPKKTARKASKARR